MPEVTFFYPSRAIGGAQLLFLRLASELARRSATRVNVVDFADGFLAGRIAGDAGVQLIEYRGRPVRLPGGTILVAPLSLAADLGMFVHPDGGVRLLLWMIHPENIRHVLYGMGRRHAPGLARAREAVRTLAAGGSVIYMDSATRAALEAEVGAAGEPRYLPIPHGVDAAPAGARTRTPGELHVAWLGRLAADKIHALFRIADEIRDARAPEAITLHVIGDGDRAAQVRRHLEAAGIRYRMPGVLADDALTAYVARHVDLGIAMGTSCLELAARGIPALLIDYSLSPFPRDTRYNWLFESDCFTLGAQAGSAERRHDFAAVLRQWRDDPGLGERSRRYATTHHAVEHVARQLLAHAEHAPVLDAPALRRLTHALRRGGYGWLLEAAWSVVRRARAARTRTRPPALRSSPS